MSKSFIRGNLSAYIPDIQATAAQGLTYVFGLVLYDAGKVGSDGWWYSETNSYFNHGVPGQSLNFWV